MGKGEVIKHLSASEVVFLCIGTDRSTGDSLGPLVGTYLSDLGYNVIGTIDEPCHAMNLSDRLEETNGLVVIAVDASLGRVSRIGEVIRVVLNQAQE